MRRIQSGRKGKSLERVTKRVLIPRNRALSARLGSSGGSTGDGISVAQTIFADEEIKQCPVAPMEIVPAPGTGKILLPVSAMMALDNGAGPYDDCRDMTMRLSHAGFNRGRSSTYSELAQGAFQDGTDAPHFLGSFVGLNPASWFGDPSNTLDKPLTVAMYNAIDENEVGTNPLTGGDPANTLTVTVAYMTVTVAA